MERGAIGRRIPCGVTSAPSTPAPGAIGLILPTLPQDTVPSWADTTAGDPASDPVADLVATCQGAEAAGATTLWACDHLFWHGPCLECTVALTVAATATTTAMLGSCVIQLPLRRSVAVAKQFASLQALSRGRMILGVGVGSHEGEYVQVGADYHHRGHDLDDGIDDLHRAWASGEGADRGDTTSAVPAERYRQLPAAPPVPVWVGGSSEAALHRAATRGDGWMPLFLSVDEYGEAVRRLAKEADAAGRDPGDVTPAMVVFVAVDDDADAGRAKGTAWMSSLYGLPPKAFERHLVAGSATEVARQVTAYQEAGAEHVAVYVTDDAPLPQFAQLMAALPGV
jgi:alkanesulfonate monooxygenase SsuD/methylene tetrahydromethanopterin reductase-like flavin-dependent oxidoreductase (luciferase family)